MGYEYVTSINRYRNADTGRFVPRSTVMAYVNQITAAGQEGTQPLAGLVTDGTLSPKDYSIQFKGELKSSYIQSYILGRGGRDQMTPRDWGNVGAMLKDQYKRVDGFVADLQKTEMSQAAVEARQNLYFQRTRQAYETGNAAAYGVPKLPAYPGDMSTECKGGCNCFWDIQTLDGDGNFDCYWRNDPTADNCETCLQRADEWSPLEVRNGVLQSHREIKAEAHAHRH